MARARIIYTLKHIAEMIGENLELLKEVTANSEISARANCFMSATAANTARRPERERRARAQNLLADIRTWDGGIRQFLVDEQCDPDVVERVMADEMKPGL